MTAGSLAKAAEDQPGIASTCTDGSGGGRERSLANLRPFAPGQSGNPGGGSRRQRMQHEARWSGEHGRDKTVAVLDKLRALALAGDVQAAKVYLDRIVGPVHLRGDEGIDLTTAPDAVLVWLAEHGT